MAEKNPTAVAADAKAKPTAEDRVRLRYQRKVGGLMKDIGDTWRDAGVALAADDIPGFEAAQNLIAGYTQIMNTLGWPQGGGNPPAASEPTTAA